MQSLSKGVRAPPQQATLTSASTQHPTLARRMTRASGWRQCSNHTTHAHGLATLPPSSSTTSTTSTELLRHPLGLASSLLQASTSYYYDYNAVRDRRGRTTRAGAADAPAALHRLMDTDEAMTMPTPHLHHHHHHAWRTRSKDRRRRPWQLNRRYSSKLVLRR